MIDPGIPTPYVLNAAILQEYLIYGSASMSAVATVDTFRTSDCQIVFLSSVAVLSDRQMTI